MNLTHLSAFVGTFTYCVAAHAAVINVTTPNDDDGNGSRTCSLREAIRAANSDTAYGGCPRGNGDDIIRLASGGTYQLTRTANLSITSTLLIEGNNATIRGPNGAGSVAIEAGAYATLASVKLTAFAFAPALVVSGNLQLNYSEVYSNTPDLTIQSSVWVLPSGGLFARSSVFRNNRAIKGGGIYVNGGYAFLQNVTVANNVASQYGGGIAINGQGYAELQNCTISGNQGTANFSAGGGIWIGESGSSDILASTIVNNRVLLSGGGILVNSPSARASLQNSIIQDNVSVGPPPNPVECLGHITSYGNNLASRFGCVLSRFTESPPDITTERAFLGPLMTVNGGLLPVHKPEPGSVVIDKISLDYCNLNFDQLGAARPNGWGCDIGAVEYYNLP